MEHTDIGCLGGLHVSTVIILNDFINLDMDEKGGE